MSGIFNSIKRATGGVYSAGQGSSTSSGPDTMRFTIAPAPGDTGFSQWAAAMKMVAQLPGGIPPEFRSRLWLNLAEKHLVSRNVDWAKVEQNCFSEWSHPADAELGVQIVKDLHRTGCSLFCGKEGVENQVLLKRVLLAYARWNKAVGYCQGFNMLAALILQVTEKNEADSLKLMIYLIEGVLPDCYFADSLRGLSVDMAVFRELLKSRLPKLSRHLDNLQNAAKDGTTSYEPPLTNVFTMQWFLTLFCNCLPQDTVLRVWDLILLEGNEILLRTALAIWQVLADRILSVRSADEFYCIMGVLTRELLEFGLVDGNSLIKAVVQIGHLSELKSLREHYMYNINPWGPSLPQAVVDRQLKLHPKERLVLDISALKKQYVKLKQRQRQAHIIFSAAISRQPPPSTPVAMNHLLLGKSALVGAKRLGPPKGSIPPARQQAVVQVVQPSTLHWKDTKQSSSSSSSDTELCDEEDEDSLGSSLEEENCQLNPTDNPTSIITPTSDTTVNLMNNDDNTSSAKGASINNESLLDFDNTISQIAIPTSDNLVLDDEPQIILSATESDDDENFDFETFLADRVSCLNKEEVSCGLDKENVRADFARRNSVRALQIIQENSLILHRILQCQSNISPLDNDEDNGTVGTIETLSLCDTDTLMDQCSFNVDRDELKSPEYGSKYSSILEKSKSLDERYNSLILNAHTRSKSNTSAELKVLAEPDEKRDNFLTDVSSESKSCYTFLASPIEDTEDLLSTQEGLGQSGNYLSNSIESKNSPLKDLEIGSYLNKLEEPVLVEELDFTIQKYLEQAEKTSPLEVDSSINFSEKYSSLNEVSIRNYLEEAKNMSPIEESKSLHQFDEEEVDVQKSPIGEENTLQNYLDNIEKTSRRFLQSEDTKISEDLLIDDPSTDYQYISGSPIKEQFYEDSPDFDCFKASPSHESCGESSKSPSKVFNPFPVSVSSRQSKEVPLKLGLYKK